MMTADNQATPAPPNLISALVGGFDAVTSHLGVIIFPVLLDLFLWWGPQLRLKTLILGLLNQMAALSGSQTPEMAELVNQTRTFWTPLAEGFNLFSALRSYPVGIPSLMAARPLGEAPFGTALAWEVPSVWAGFGAWLFLNLAGLVFGTLFFILVVQAVMTGKVDWQQAIQRWPWSALQVLLLALFWAAILLAFSLPLSCLFPILMLGGLSLGQMGIFLYGALIIWLLFPLLLSAHGIFLNHRKMWGSLQDGYRLTRMTALSTGAMFLIILLLSQGLDLLWSVPPQSSWLALVGILGHAFIATGLLATTFVYYRDASRWTQRVEQQIKFWRH